MKDLQYQNNSPSGEQIVDQLRNRLTQAKNENVSNPSVNRVFNLDKCMHDKQLEKDGYLKKLESALPELRLAAEQLIEEILRCSGSSERKQLRIASILSMTRDKILAHDD